MFGIFLDELVSCVFCEHSNLFSKLRRKMPKIANNDSKKSGGIGQRKAGLAAQNLLCR
jgi:hypothetical protein